MKRNKIADASQQDRLKQLNQCIAFHEAGHAVAIYLNNKAKNLPPVYFQIIFKAISSDQEYDALMYQATHDDSIARVEGGRLIQSLPYSIDDLAHQLTDRNDAMMPLLRDYIIAFEADIVNLLVGPLAEAKHVYSRDDELFNHQLVNLKALTNYGGSSDLALAHKYLESFTEDRQLREEKLDRLFAEAFDFVNDYNNWRAISRLADYLLKVNKNSITCEEVIAVLDS